MQLVTCTEIEQQFFNVSIMTPVFQFRENSCQLKLKLSFRENNFKMVNLIEGK